MRSTSSTGWSSRASGLLAAAALSAGCNHYELFRVAGYSQEEFSNDADVLFVIDNSSSMEDEAAALALNMDVFIRRLTDPSEGGHGTDGLVDAVDAYIDYVQNRAFVVDYQLAITTTDVQGRYGDLYGDPRIIENSFDGDIATAFNRNLMCQATCFLDAGTLPSDPGYDCADPPPPPGDAISPEYLDCLCGGRTWEGQCGAGNEEPLEAIFMAMCRAAEEPPEECFEEVNQFTEADVGSNAGLLRPDSTLIPIIVTDEGDTSRRMSQGDGEPDEYAELFAKFGQRMAFAVIGPNTEECNSGAATAWGVDRYEWFVAETNGRFFQITEPAPACGVADFQTAMEELGALLNGLRVSFTLQGVPDVDTIRAFVDGDEVDRSVETFDDDLGLAVYGDGWSYDPIRNAVTFHGAAVPDYGMPVQIYYRPIQGMPRDLPF